MKLVVNLILILLISISLFVLPLNMNLLNLDLSKISEESRSPDETDNSIYLITPLNNQAGVLYDPSVIEFRLDSDHEFPKDVEDNIKLKFEFFSTAGDKLLFDEKSLDFELRRDGKSLVFSVKIDREKLNLKYTGYKLYADFNYKNANSNMVYDVFYTLDNFANASIPKEADKKYAPLFFYDESGRFMVPVYRPHIDESNQFANVLYSADKDKAALKALRLEPWPLNLDFRPRMWFSNGLLTVSLANSNVDKITDPLLVKRSLIAMTESFAAADTGFVVKEVSYFLTEASEQKIAGVAVGQPVSVDSRPKVYLPLICKDNSYLWAVERFELTNSIVDDVNYIVDAYSGSFANLNDDRIPSILPPIRLIEKINVMDKTIYLDLNREALKFFDKRPHYARALVDGLLLSLTSIGNIESVGFTVGGSELNKIGDVPIGNTAAPPDIVNIIN